MSYKRQLQGELYGGLYPYWWVSTVTVERVQRALKQTGLRWIVVKNKNTIDLLLTEKEAEGILRVLKE